MTADSGYFAFLRKILISLLESRTKRQRTVAAELGVDMTEIVTKITRSFDLRLFEIEYCRGLMLRNREIKPEYLHAVDA
jgi:hypothetical protein